MSHLMHLSTAVLLITAASCVVLGVLVRLRKKNARNDLFLLFNLNLAVWALLMLGVLFSWREPGRMALWIRFSTAVSLFIPVNLYHFATAVTGDHRARRREIAAWHAAALAGVGLVFRPAFLREAFFYQAAENPVFSSPEAAYGPSFTVLAVLILFLLGRAMWHLQRRRVLSSGLHRAEIGYILLGILAGSVFATFTSIVSPFLGISRITPLGPFSAVLMSAVIAYGIARSRILDVSFVLNRAAFYTILACLLALVYLLVIGFCKLTVGPFLPAGFFLPDLLAALAVAFAVTPLRERLQALIGGIFYSSGEKPERVLAELADILNAQVDMSEKLQAGLRRTASFLGVDDACLLTGDDGRFSVRACTGAREMPPGAAATLACAPGIVALARQGAVVVREEWERLPETPARRAVTRALAELKFELVVPVLARAELLGFFLFGAREDRKMFTVRDLEFARAAAGQAAGALKNAQLLDRLQKAERLVAVGTLAAGMAHEIRNPLVSIKTFVQLLPEKFNDPDFRQTFARIASQEVDRINGLIGDLLSFARPAALDRKPVDPVEVIDQALFLLGNRLDEHGIRVERRPPTGPVLVEADEAALQRVFSNLFLNAVQAMEAGGVLSVSCEPYPAQGRVVFRVADTGPGISAETLARVFDPFFSTRRNGTGLGLALVQTIVQEHGGEITAASEPGRGAIFTVSLPLVR